MYGNIGIADQHPAIPVVRLEPSQEERLAGVLIRAFHDEPPFRYMVPDEQERLRLLTGYFRWAIRASQQYGAIHTTPTVEGGALWVSPEHMLEWSNLSRYMYPATPLEEVHSRLAGRSHWYLLALGVEPSQQGMGIGGRLIQPILRQADTTGRSCYLRTFNEKSLRFFESHGFRIAAAGKIHDLGPDFWAMLRAPQGTACA